MPQRGPVPLAPHVRALRGNTHDEPIPAAPSAATGRIPKPPDWMTAGQKAIWKDIQKHAPKDLLARVDAGVLMVYVTHRFAFEAIAADCGDNTLLLTKRARELELHQKAMLKAAAALGLDPSTRARIRFPATEAPKQKTLFERMRDSA